MDIIWVIVSLIGVLGLFFALIYALKKLNKGISFANGNKMRVIDRVSVGRDSMLLVVSVAGKLMLIGASGQHIEKLSDIDMSVEEYMAQTQDASGNGMNFKDAISEVLKRNKRIEEPEEDGKND